MKAFRRVRVLHVTCIIVFNLMESMTFQQQIVFRCEEHLYKRLLWLVRPLVGWSVCPHDAITWKTSYVAIALRRGGGRGY
jgi:hypothetical protein